MEPTRSARTVSVPESVNLLCTLQVKQLGDISSRLAPLQGYIKRSPTAALQRSLHDEVMLPLDGIFRELRLSPILARIGRPQGEDLAGLLIPYSPEDLGRRDMMAWLVTTESVSDAPALSVSQYVGVERRDYIHEAPAHQMILGAGELNNEGQVTTAYFANPFARGNCVRHRNYESPATVPSTTPPNFGGDSVRLSFVSETVGRGFVPHLEINGDDSLIEALWSLHQSSHNHVRIPISSPDSVPVFRQY